MTTDYFPAEIWREILLQQPVESLIRFATVCKSWKSLITSPDFIYAHLSHSKNHSLLRRCDEHDKHDHYLPLEFTETGSNGSFEIDARSNPKIPFKSKLGRYGIVGSCDGIVCLSDEFFLNSSHRVILWNPSVRNHVVLPRAAITDPKGPKMVLLGFGVAKRVYKVVRLVYCWNPDEFVYEVPQQAEIFTLGTERWRSVWGVDVKIRFCYSMWRQVLLKGIIHWLGYETIDDGSSRSSILAFDVGDEAFGQVMLPDVLALEGLDRSELCLYKIGGSLAVVTSDPFTFTDSCDVWVMKEYGVKESWTKLYRIDFAKKCKNECRIFKVVGFKNGEAVLAYYWPFMGPGWPDLVSYNLETKQAKDLETYGTPRSFFIDDYVESLLLLKGNSVPGGEECGEEPLEGLSSGGCWNGVNWRDRQDLILFNAAENLSLV